MAQLSSRALQILIIDPDPMMRLGLRVTLERAANWHVLEAETATAGLTLLRQQLAAPGIAKLGLVIVEPTLQLNEQPGQPYLWQFLKPAYPRLPLLLLGTSPDSQNLALARRLGVEGYCPKGVSGDDLVKLVAQLSNGERAWPVDIQRQLLGLSPTATSALAQLKPWQRWRYGVIAAGLAEMDATLAEFHTTLQREDLAWLDHLILSGRQREVRVARWLVSQALPAAVKSMQVKSMQVKSMQLEADQPAPPPTVISRTVASAAVNPTALAITTTPIATALAEPQFAHLRAILFESLRTKAGVSVGNSSPQLLEIDILRPAQRLELIDTVLHRLDLLLVDLETAQLTPLQLLEQRSQLLKDLWRDSVTEFYGRYTNLLTRQTGSTTAHNTDQHNTDQIVALVPTLLQEETAVQTAILDPIPLVSDLFAHLLFGTSLQIQNSQYAPGTIEAMRYAQIILENLVLQMANAVVQPLLNQFADQEVIKQTYYDSPLLSSRDVERFRNRLSWQYRMQSLFQEPQAIFESRVGLLNLTETGIRSTSMYLPRQEELRQLQGFRAWVTLALEFRDAVAPPLRNAFGFLGQGIVYFLTQVVGRGLGLIGRGIAQGLGSSWQEGQAARRNQPPL